MECERQHYMRAQDFCDQIGADIHTVYEMAKLKEDPMPVRYLPGRRRGGFFIVSELDEWLVRNTTLMASRT